MKRADLVELHYITPIANVPSITKHGILSNARVKKVQHESVALATVQEIRDNVRVPGGRPLHDYVNLYLCARNPMLFLRKGQHEELCVLRISPDVIDLDGSVVTSGNASGSYVRFSDGAKGLAIVDKDLTFAEYWTDPDLISYFQKKSAKCAEVLVPDRVPMRFVVGAYVSGSVGRKALEACGAPFPIEVNKQLFFL